MSINTLEGCRESAAAYLKYLKVNKKGKVLNHVSEITQDGNLFSLKIEKPLFTSDASELSLQLGGHIHSKDDFSFVEYDQDNLLLFVQPATDSLCNKLSNAKDVNVVTDLTFLVSRICDLYGNQKKLFFPLPKPTCLPASSFDESKLSDE